MRRQPAVAPDGRVVVVWQRYSELWQRSSSDGGATWSDERLIAGCRRATSPALATVGGDLWLVYERDEDIWYRTSTDQGRHLVGRDAFHSFRRQGRCAGSSRAGVGQRRHRLDTRTAAATRISGSASRASGMTSTRRLTSNGSTTGPRPTRTATTPSPSAPARMDETGVASVHLVWTLDGDRAG